MPAVGNSACSRYLGGGTVLAVGIGGKELCLQYVWYGTNCACIGGTVLAVDIFQELCLQ